MPNALGWTIREKFVGYEVLIWSGADVLYRGHARTRAQAARLAEHWRKKLLPEAFRREEKEVDA